MACLTLQIHYCCNQTNIYTIKEISMTLFVMLICVTNTSKVDFSNAMLFQPTNSTYKIVFGKTPEHSKIVHHSIRNNTKRYTITSFLINLHQTVNSIIQGRITTDNNDGLISIIDHHLNESVNTTCCFTLNEIKLNFILIKHTLNFLPAFACSQSSFRTIEDAPSV